MGLRASVEGLTKVTIFAPPVIEARSHHPEPFIVLTPDRYTRCAGYLVYSYSVFCDVALLLCSGDGMPLYSQSFLFEM